MNKDLFLDGKEYISASRASKKFGYAQDYIGYLIRTNKVPGRMIGRTWYVEVSALSSHKKTRGKKKTKGDVIRAAEGITEAITPEIIEAPQDVCEEVVEEISPIEEKSVIEIQPAKEKISEFIYESDTRSRLPELSKTKYKAKESSHFVKRLAVGLVAFVMIIGTSLKWISYLSPTFSDNLNIKIAELSDVANQKLATVEVAINQIESVKKTTSQVESIHFGAMVNTASIKSAAQHFFAGFFGRSKELLARWIHHGKQEIAGNPHATEADSFNTGIVVTPDEKDHAALVSRIKSSFSDDVEVAFDEEGDAGVVKPVFHDGDDTENYAFVMVPIKQK